MPRVFAIGDIHGCCKTFKKLLLDKIVLKKSDKIYCIGDYVDRGKDSKGVIDFIIELRKIGYQIFTLRGNHEQMMLDSSIDNKKLEHWLINGGEQTLESFGISSVKKLTKKYLNFLKQTEIFIATDKYIFVHAGLNFNLDNPFTDKEAMLWIRDEYFDKSKINNRFLIHGHTPLPLKLIYKQLKHNRINIDAGCVFKAIPSLGNLVAISLPDMQIISIPNID